MAMQLKNFQLKAIDSLMAAMHNDKREIILKSCTGNGKTIILTHFIDTFMRSFGNTVFIWLTPGKGNLEEQSKKKMDQYINGASTKLLCEIMTGGIHAGDSCFINWEKLTKKGNTALRDSERTNFLEHIAKALNSGITFKVIISFLRKIIITPFSKKKSKIIYFASYRQQFLKVSYKQPRLNQIR